MTTDDMQFPENTTSDVSNMDIEEVAAVGDDENIEQFFTPLPERGVIAIHGPDARKFLQNILTNDISLVSEKQVIFSALLTPQGKFLYDFFICQAAGEDTLLLDCYGAWIPDIIALLNKYKLQSKVEIKDVSEKFLVMALFGDGIVEAIDEEETAGAVHDFGQGIIYIDPRTADMQARVLFYYSGDDEELPDFIGSGFTPVDHEVYEYLRLWVGMPDPAQDMVSGESFPLEYGFQNMNAIAFDKGCYVGQEVTTRVHQRGEIKRTIYPVMFNGTMPEPQEPIMAGQKKIGIFCSGIENIGIAHMAIAEVEEVLAHGEKLFARRTEIIVQDGMNVDEVESFVQQTQNVAPSASS